MGIFLLPTLVLPPSPDPITVITNDVKTHIFQSFNNQNLVFCEMLMTHVCNNTKIYYLWTLYLELTKPGQTKEQIRFFVEESIKEIKVKIKADEIRHARCMSVRNNWSGWGEKGRLNALNWLLGIFETNYLPALK